MLELEAMPTVPNGTAPVAFYLTVDKTESSRSILDALLSSATPAKHQRPLPLSVLNLKGFDLKACGALLSSTIDFPEIQTLILQDCQNVSALLWACCSFAELKLSYLLIRSEYRIETKSRAAFSRTAINSVLGAAKNLRGLAIDAIEDHTLEPAIDSLANFSLENLIIRCSPPQGINMEGVPEVVHRHWTTQELYDLMYMCPSLTELGINFPPMPISFDLEWGMEEEAPEYLEFIVSVLRIATIFNFLLMEAKSTLEGMSMLTDLQDFTSPSQDWDEPLLGLIGEQHDAFRNQQCRVLAEHVMTALPKLRSFTLGVGISRIHDPTTFHRHWYWCGETWKDLAVRRYLLLQGRRYSYC